MLDKESQWHKNLRVRICKNCGKRVPFLSGMHLYCSTYCRLQYYAKRKANLTIDNDSPQ